MFSRMFAPIGRLPVAGSLSTMLYPGTETKNSDDDFLMMQQELSLFVPVAEFENSDLSFNLTGEQFLLDERLYITDPLIELPDAFYDLEAGAVYRRQFSGGNMGGAFVSVGSASDELFEETEDVAVNLSGYYRYSLDSGNAWIFLLSYDNQRDFLKNIPLPGAAYEYRRGRELTAIVGVPFVFLDWKPNRKWSASVSYFVPYSVGVSTRYHLWGPVFIHGAFDWDEKSYFRTGREDDDDNIYYYEKRLTAGANVYLNNNFSLDLSGGFAFDRYIYEGEDFDDDDGKLEFEDGVFAEVKLGFRF
jgi:hypothetical protein